MKIEMKPEWSDEFQMCFSDIEIVRADGEVVFATNQPTDNVTMVSIVKEYFAEVDIEEFQAEVRSWFGDGAEFTCDEFDIMKDGKAISDTERNEFLIHAVDNCGFRVAGGGAVRDFK